jgi:PAS domain S-box-containing protein
MDMCAQSSSFADFSFLFFSGADPMWIFDIHTLQILEVNEAAVIVYGYTKAEFLSKTITDLRPPEDVPALKDVLPEILDRKSDSREFRHINKNGQIMHVEITSYPFNYNGRSTRLVTVNNIDEIKAISSRLAETENRLEKILDTTAIGFYQLDHMANITYWNKAAENLLSYQREYVVNKNLWDVFPEMVFSEFYTAINKVLAEKITVDFKEYFWPVQKWFSVYVYPIEEGVVVHFRDITEKQLAIEGLHEKIRQLREVAFLNSHYIRKPLASLLGLSELMREDLEVDEMKQIAAHMYTCSQELDEAVKKVNKMVTKDDLIVTIHEEMEDFSFRSVIKESLCSIRFKYDNRRLLLKGKEDVIYFGNKDSVRFVLEVLVDNAVRFSAEGTRVVVNIDVINNNVVLSVRDYGCGMSEAELYNLFLNLSKRKLETSLLKVNDIVTRHNGNIWVESRVKKGSTFFVRFPLSNLSALKAGREGYYMTNQLGLDLTYNGIGNYLCANWYGFHSFHTVKAGGLKLLEAIKRHKCTALLNDNTHLMGSWENATEWIATDFVPLLKQTGLTHFAWIYSPSAFSKMATDHTVDILPNEIVVRTFNNKEEGIKWLREVTQSNDNVINLC